jgi:hypothetical protein
MVDLILNIQVEYILHRIWPFGIDCALPVERPLAWMGPQTKAGQVESSLVIIDFGERQ